MRIIDWGKRGCRARQDRVVRKELPKEVVFEHLWEDPCWYRELKVQKLKSRTGLWVCPRNRKKTNVAGAKVSKKEK